MAGCGVEDAAGAGALAGAAGGCAPGFSGALAGLAWVAWPCGLLQSALLLSALASGPAIGLGDLPGAVAGLSASQAPLLADLPPEGCMLDDVLGEVERRLILQALARTGGVRKAAAKLLGVTFRSLRYRLVKHALAAEVDEDESLDSVPGDGGRETSPPAVRR